MKYADIEESWEAINGGHLTRTGLVNVQDESVLQALGSEDSWLKLRTAVHSTEVAFREADCYYALIGHLLCLTLLTDLGCAPRHLLYTLVSLAAMKLSMNSFNVAHNYAAILDRCLVFDLLNLFYLYGDEPVITFLGLPPGLSTFFYGGFCDLIIRHWLKLSARWPVAFLAGHQLEFAVALLFYFIFDNGVLGWKWTIRSVISCVHPLLYLYLCGNLRWEFHPN